MEKLFFDLIRVAIGNAVCLSHTPTNVEWMQLYELAKKQSLVGICFAGVQRLQKQKQCPPEVLYLQWMGMAAKIQQRNEIMLNRCKELKVALHKYGIRCSILKGAGMGAYYGKLACLRQSGDIDVYVDCGLEKSITIAHDYQEKNDWDYKHLHLDIFDGVGVELHYRTEVILDPWKNKIFQDFVMQPEVNASIFDNEYEGLITPTLRFAIVHNILHLYQHYCFSGVGFRQIIDLYFLLTKSNQSDRLFAIDILRKLDIIWFVKGLMWILTYKLGMSNDVSICEGFEKEGISMFEKVCLSGNFGKYEDLEVRGGKFYSLYRLIRHNSALALQHPRVVVGVLLYFVWTNIWKFYYSLKLK